MTNKWRNFSFRSTAGGSNTWAGGAINASTDVDPNDASNTTTVITAMGGYPLPSSDGVHSYGFSNSSGGTVADLTKTNAGSNTLLGGFLTIANAREAAQFDVDANTPHDVRIALGSAAGSRQTAIVYDGTFTRMGTDLGGLVQTINLWAAGTSSVVGALIASKIDKWIWKLTAVGSPATYAASGEPNVSGTGGTYNAGTGIYTDANGVQWTKQARQVLLIVDVTTTGGSLVADQTNTAGGTAASGWASAATATLTSTLGCFTILKCAASSGSLRQFSVRSQGATLVDVTLTDEAGVAQGGTPTVYCGQPNGYAALKIGGAAGAGAAANFALSGTLAPYFSLQTFNTNEVWLVANSTRLPESLAGTQTLTITQTDAASTGSPHATSFSCTVVSSAVGGVVRPLDNTLLGSITTQSWIKHQTAKTVTDAAWTGAAGKSYLTSTTVADTASWLAAQAAAQAASTGSSYHEILLGSGTYAGNQASPVRLDFGSGGLYVAPAPGADPEFSVSYTDIQAHGVHFDGVLMPNDPTVTGSAFQQFIFTDEGASGISGNGRFNRVLFTNCRIGFMHHSGNVITDWATKSCQFLNMAHGESLEFRGCSLWGNKLLAHPGTTRLQRYLDLSARQDSDDVVQVYNIALPTVTLAAAVTAAIPGQTIFPDNNTYIDCSRWVVYTDPDYPSYSNGKHCDTVQISRSYGNAPNWSASTTFNVGSLGLTTYCVSSAAPFRLYKFSAGLLFTGATTNSAGYAAGVSTVTLASAGSGAIAIGDKFQFSGDSTVYTATSAVANVGAGGSLSFSPVLVTPISAAPKAMTSASGVTAASPATGPSGTGTGITDGTAKWDYVLDLPTDADIYVVMEDVVVCSEGPLANQNDRQYLFDGNGGRGFKTHAVILNGVDATSAHYGPAVGSGSLSVEFCAFGGPPRLGTGQIILDKRIQSFNDGNLRSFHNIGCANTTGSGVVGQVTVASGTSFGTGTAAIQDELSLDWSSTTGPAASLTGPFIADTKGSGQASYPSLTDTPDVARATFRANFRNVFTPLLGTAGPFPDAATTVSGGGLRLGLGLSL